MSTGDDRSTGAARASFASILERCRSLFPPALLDAAGWERIIRAAKPLPRAVADTHFGFEFHLAEPNADADLVVLAIPGSEVARHYVSAGKRAAPGSAAAALASGLERQAADPNSYLARGVRAMMLEYDMTGLAPHRPVPPPGVFFSPSKSAPGSRDGVPEHGDAAALLEALAVTAGWNSHREIVPTVERIVAALPEAAYVFQAGAHPARSPKGFRILLWDVAPQEVPALLQRLEWPGSTAAAAAVLAAMEDLITYVAVGLEVTAQGIGPRLGLELYRPVRWFDADARGWHPFIDRVAEQGWCMPEKAAGLRRWPGVERMLGDGKLYIVRQGISYFKVVVERGAPTAAKAYTGMSVLPYRHRPAESPIPPPDAARP